MEKCRRRRGEGREGEEEEVVVNPVKMERVSMVDRVLDFPSEYTPPLSISCRKYCS